MNTTGKKSIIRTLVFALCIMFSAVAAAHGGWHGGGGGWHGGGGGWHGGGWHGGGWHGGGWHGGGWYGGAVIVGAPLYYGYYGGYGCQTIRVCNAYGNCWLQQSCY
ncbi:hypothetical protein [Legionella fallonii]|uniref:Glycine-rich protein n=1 Tax=Legionella fallonii LLAP-10 TaxID=1212491 RepID=A0A098G571_9GAMM|nr:hypothetical protein [Legionella fallonii]CEG57139.1 Glycine-rich protein [Legionella fallonii LLAP-10]